MEGQCGKCAHQQAIDGVLILRHLFSCRGNALVQGVLSPTETCINPAAMTAILDALGAGD